MEPNGTNDNRVNTTVLCRTGCGFYGSISYEGLCSKCYTETAKSRHESSIAEKMSEQISGVDSSHVHIEQSIGEIDNQAEESLVAREVCEALRRVSISERSTRATSSSPAAPQADNVATAAEPASGASSCSPEAAAAITCDSTLEESTNDAAAAAAAIDVAVEAEGAVSEGKTKKKNRCHSCNKRVGLTGFPCRCGGLYCSLHRYSDTHECTFNYKQLAQEDIRKNNPVVVSEKIKKI